MYHAAGRFTAACIGKFFTLKCRGKFKVCLDLVRALSGVSALREFNAEFLDLSPAELGQLRALAGQFQDQGVWPHMAPGMFIV